MALYKRALTADERTWLYNSGEGRSYTNVVASHYGWVGAEYAYDSDQPHAMSSVTRDTTTDTYAYDENGNMTCRFEDSVT